MVQLFEQLLVVARVEHRLPRLCVRAVFLLFKFVRVLNCLEERVASFDAL